MVRPVEVDSFDDLIQVRCTKAFKRQVEFFAAERGRDASSFIRGLIAKHMRQSKKEVTQ